jgi:UDP:flavonoid glycosyltransferase YjiC (YdhE family)
VKIVLSTFGSRGDVQPMLALALGFRAAGHKVLLIGPPEKAAWAADLGCPYQGAGNNVSALIDSLDSAHTARSALIFTRYVRREVAVQFAVLPDLVQGADRIVAASLCFGLASLAEALRIPYRFITFAPQLIPSGFHPFPAFRRQRLPRWCNRAGWGLAKAMDRFNLTRLVNAHRRNMGLLPVRDFLGHILGHRVIVASDAAVAAVPPDVKTQFIQTGYMHLDQPEQHMPELEEYLAAGTKPVYAGFGSMPPRDQSRLVPLIVAAARAAGRRVVISRFWHEPQTQKYGDDVFFIQKCPHRRLFPKMAAIVHHGGAGTTATAAISGVPQVVVPHILDQYYWGDRIRRAGLGPPPVWRSRLTAAGLARAIRACTTNPTYGQKAGLVGEAIRRRNGVVQTMQAILADQPLDHFRNNGLEK